MKDGKYLNKYYRIDEKIRFLKRKKVGELGVVDIDIKCIICIIRS